MFVKTISEHVSVLSKQTINWVCSLSTVCLLQMPVSAATQDVAESARGSYVGKLEQLWTLPSDHLPIGMLHGDEKILSWNVLNSLHMSWVMEKDSQGLKDSVIGKEHVVIQEDGLTLRDQHVVELIGQMNFDLLALQEAGTPFVEYLKTTLSDEFTIVHHGELALILRSDRYKIVESKEVFELFSPWDRRPVQHVLLERNDGSELLLINAHLPGDPTKPSPQVFASHISSLCSEERDLIALGDMNFNELEMGNAFKATSISHYSPTYCTNIGPFSFISKTIDHFFVHSKQEVTVRNPDDILSGLQTTADLLQ